MVCPWWLCYIFDNPLRKFIHNPEEILSSYVSPGNTVIDVGAGMGYFSIALARLVGPTGHVIAIDIQAKMLSTLTRRTRKYGLSDRISLYLAAPDSLGNHPKADFILTFWMVHEVQNQRAFFEEIFNLSKPGALFLLVEPILHVSKKAFLEELQIADEIGFTIKGKPRIRLSHSVLLMSNKNGSQQDDSMW